VKGTPIPPAQLFAEPVPAAIAVTGAIPESAPATASTAHMRFIVRSPCS